MNIKYLKQMLTYFSRVYHLGEKINRLVDKRSKPQVTTATIAFTVLFGFMLQMRSFNKLEHWLERGKFKKLFHKGTKLPRIDTIRRSLSQFELRGLNAMHNDIIKTTIKTNM